MTKNVLALTLLGLAACSQETSLSATRSVSPDDGPAAHATSLRVVSLVVTVDDADTFGNAYGIRSDGKGSYIDGTQSVQALLDTYGTFAFNTYQPSDQGKNQPPASRWVRYDFNNPVDPSNTYRPTPNDGNNYHFSTGAAHYSPTTWVPLQNLPIGTSECGRMGNSFSQGTTVGNSTTWQVSFHENWVDQPQSPTAYAVFTRVSAGQWMVQPGSCGEAQSDVAASLRDRDTGTIYGNYRLPFHFTLTAK